MDEIMNTAVKQIQIDLGSSCIRGVHKESIKHILEDNK